MATQSQPQPEFMHHIPLKPPPSEALTIATPTPLDLLQQAILQGVSVDQLERLQAMYERWDANEARKAYVRAKAAFKSEAPTILRNKHVKIEPKDQTRRRAEYDHATLDHVCDQVIPLLAKHGFDHDWKMEQNGEWIKVTCILKHDAGHFEERSLAGTPDNTGFKNPVQMIASTVTYLQRYTLLAVCGLAAKGTDSDGRVTLEAGLGEKRTDQLGQAIANANTLDELKTVYFGAYREAEKAKDATAKQLFMRTAAARKRELQ